MNIFTFFGYLSGVVSVFCYLPYIRDILLKKTKPKRASWIIWATLGLVAFFSQLFKGANNSLWMPGIQTIGTIIIAVLSLRFGVGGFVKGDILSMLAAFFGIILWFFTKEPLFALLITIAVDTIGEVLTIIKSYKNPETETLLTWILASASGLLSAISVGSLNWILLIYPIYFFVINLIVVVAIVKGKRN